MTYQNTFTPTTVAILAIMELGDLQTNFWRPTRRVLRRNPRYNGIG